MLAAQRVDSIPGIASSTSRARLAAGYLSDSDTSTSLADAAITSKYPAPAEEPVACVSDVTHTGRGLEVPGSSTEQQNGGGGSSSVDDMMPSVSQAHLAEGYVADSDASTAAGGRHRAAGAPPVSAFAAAPPPSVAADSSAESAAAPLSDVAGAVGSALGNGAVIGSASADNGSPLSVVPEVPPPPPFPPQENSVEEHDCGNPTDSGEESPEELRRGAAPEPVAAEQHASKVAEDRQADDQLQARDGEESGVAAGSGGMFAGLDLA